MKLSKLSGLFFRGLGLVEEARQLFGDVESELADVLKEEITSGGDPAAVDQFKIEAV